MQYSPSTPPSHEFTLYLGIRNPGSTRFKIDINTHLTQFHFSLSISTAVSMQQFFTLSQILNRS